jgi:4-aminobutyrate aminotransferase
MTGNTRVFLTNSGAESVEAAFKLARYHTRRPRMLAYISAFHGRTMGALSLTASKAVQRKGFAPLVPGVTHVPYPYCYRCPFGRSYPSCDLYCASYIEEVVLKSFCPASEVAALFAEPIQGEGGYVVPPPGYWQRIREMCDRHGILLAMDEIQSGMGRTGKMFAIEHWDTEPDVVALAKGIASGMPLGAIVAREAIMDWPPGSHGTTFGGNPVCCAAALATLDVIEDGLIENAATQGAYMLDALRDMQTRFPAIGDVRGKGLMIAVEWVKDPESKERAPELRSQIIQECYLRGLLVLGCGQNNLRISPPLTVSRSEVDEALEILESALEACT